MQVDFGEERLNNKQTKKKPTAAKNEDDPVDQLLQSAQDELLLKLSVDSQFLTCLVSLPITSSLILTVDSKPSNPDPPQPPFNPRPASPNPDRLNSKSQDDVDPDDLFARFAAIKAPNNTTSNSIVSCHEDEIEKIIRWARDSARLDNSPLSDL
ncbi:hypothetical protein OIU84_028734 [Salix udensis]|uniref:Uncharacterized protein n=1 Tax=Salix udensis TaxID=889485 RepID=A0AAD6KD87_9ROSI|nr:hypothetical protein OIU84_028734 [Salix udensis]